MAALPKCEELQRTVNSSDWSVMFIHHCRREISKDLRLSREINALCARLTDIVDERERFVDELDRLVGRLVPERMAEFMKEVQGKDMPNRLKLQILSREFELRAREKDIFIEKLKVPVICFSLPAVSLLGVAELVATANVNCAVAVPAVIAALNLYLFVITVYTYVPFRWVEALLHLLHDGYFQSLFS
ncbi:hypothetical protein Tco_1084217 [Tanacetum coccineum]